MLERLGGRQALVAQVIQIFEEDSPALIAEVEKGFAQQDCETIHQSAHALKGLLSNFGDVECGLEISHVERCAKRDDLETAAKHFEHFKPAHQELLAALSTKS